MASSALTTDLPLAPLAPAPLAVRNLYLLALALTLAVLPALFIDLPASQRFHALEHSGPGDLRKGLALFEAFGHGIGAATIIIAVAILDRARSRESFRLAACTYGAGIVNLFFKLLFGRSRPQTFWETEFPDRASETFHGFQRLLNLDLANLFDRGLQSFPSGHSATAAGLAVGLAWLYPQGRYLFAFLAAMTMLQRMHSGAHFPSDTLAGAAVGVLVATICCDRRLCGRFFK